MKLIYLYPISMLKVSANDTEWTISQTFCRFGNVVQITGWGRDKKSAMWLFERELFYEDQPQEDIWQGLINFLWSLAKVVDTVSKFIRRK